MTANDVLRDPHLSELHGQINGIKDHARQVAGGLSAGQLKWRPTRRSWSVGECLEHLVVVADLYYDRIEELLKNEHKSQSPPAWRPSFIGRVLIKSVTTSRRLKRPKPFAPPPEPRADILQTFLESQDRLAELMRKADGVNLSGAKLSSPVSRLFRLNLGDCFTVLVLHSKRHLRQAARVATSRRLPRAASDEKKGN
jgi:hypothetical protein